MKQLIILLIGIILSFQVTSQDRLFVLHPLVGDTINRNEKLDYLLFRDINDSDFKDKDSNFKMDNIVSEDAKDRIFKEVRSENRMKGDAERLELREQGTERLTGAGRIEFYKRRKKK